VEAVLCSLADAIDYVGEVSGAAARRILLIGGAAQSPAIRELAPAIFGLPVTVPQPAEYVALGAARQAAWALAGSSQPPQWPAHPARAYEADIVPEVRARYAALRDETASWGA
jgi:xylulokinase